MNHYTILGSIIKDYYIKSKIRKQVTPMQFRIVNI